MKRQAGLTLLEMLVVLMISGMALALGFQTLGQWRRADAAISSIAGRTQEERLTQQWLHDSLRGLTPIEDVPFKGDAAQLSGISLNPVLSSQGGSTPIAWRIEPDGDGFALSLTEHGQGLQILLRDVETAHFSYVDKDGKAHPQWPPALGLADALPASIHLQMTSADGHERIWAAPIAGILNPVVFPYETEDF